MKLRIGTTIQEVRPKLYFDGLLLPTFLVASDSDEMIRFPEIQALFKGIRSPLKKLRVVRGSHTQERPAFVARQCLDFVEQVFLTTPNLAMSKENLAPQRWANDCSEFLTASPPGDAFEVDPFDRGALQRSAHAGLADFRPTPGRDLNFSLATSQHQNPLGSEKSLKHSMQKVVPYSLKADTPKLERDEPKSYLPNPRSGRLDPHLFPKRESSRSVKRKSPSNVKITKLQTSSLQGSLAASQKADPKPEQKVVNFMEVESDEEFRYF